MDLEIITLNEVISQRKIPHDITYMWNLKKKYDTNELIYKTEKDSENKLMVSKRERGRGKFGI